MGLALRVSSQKHSASEQQLVAAVRQGDDCAFEELFSRYRSRIAAYVAGMVRDHARAEDITQEVFLNALRRLRDSERPIAFKPWIYEIARNACIDEFRRTRRTSEVSLNADDDSPSGDGNLVSKQPTPDAAVENKQRLEALRGAFRGLSESHHRILVMRELEGLSYREIADRMGMSRPMVESAMFRARRRLGEEYEELSSGRRCQQVCEVVDRADRSTIRVLGVRARRQVALHLSHCDDCRRHARLAGADEALFRAPTFADKVAALLPFGWLGRQFGGRLAKTAASNYAGSVGSAAVLGRVAAAVLVLAAAGGSGYAGVSLSTGKTAAHDASAIIQRSAGGTASAATSHSAGSQTTRALASTTAGVNRSSGRGQARRLAGGAAGASGATGATGAARAAAQNKATAPAGPRHDGGSGGGGGTGSSSGGGGAATPNGSASPANAAPGPSHHSLLGNSPARGVVRKIVAPIVSSVPQAVKSTTNSLQSTANSVQSAANSVVSGATNAVPPVPTPSQLPSPQQVLSGAQNAASNAVAGAKQTVQKLLP